MLKSEGEDEKEEGDIIIKIICCRDCWARSARWNVNQYDLIETAVTVHVHEAQSDLLSWPRPLGTV